MNVGIVAVFGVLATLSADKTAVLGTIRIFGKSFFDLFDYASSNILLPIGGLLIILFTGYVANREDFTLELSNHGALKNQGLIHTALFIIKYVTPILLALVFLNSIGIIKVG